MNLISQLQSRRSRNAVAITALIVSLFEHKAAAKASQYGASRQYHREAVRAARTVIKEMAELQKQIKRDLLASKYARLQQAGLARKKHGMDDPRYEAWVQHVHEVQAGQGQVPAV